MPTCAVPYLGKHELHFFAITKIYRLISEETLKTVTNLHIDKPCIQEHYKKSQLFLLTNLIHCTLMSMSIENKIVHFLLLSRRFNINYILCSLLPELKVSNIIKSISHVTPKRKLYGIVLH